MRNATLVLAMFAMSAGCMAGDLDDVDSEEYGEGFCSGCGRNGFPPRPFGYLPGQMSVNALAGAGLTTANGKPRSICSTAVVNGGCDMRPNWQSWVANDTTGTHARQMEYLVKIVADSNVVVRTSGGASYWGMFGLAPEALTQEWGYEQQETISAGFTALLNSQSGVDICLRTERFPDRCDGAVWTHFESVTYGTHFGGLGKRHMTGAGGMNGTRYIRPCTNGDATNCADKIERRYQSSDHAAGSVGSCDFAYGANGEYATRCWGENGSVWNWPVTVLLDFNPQNAGSYYYTGPAGGAVGGPVSEPWDY